MRTRTEIDCELTGKLDSIRQQYRRAWTILAIAAACAALAVPAYFI